MNRIIVALDTSPRAAHVLDTAIDFARRVGGKLKLFRAVTLPADVPLTRYMNAPGDLAQMLLGDAMKDLTALNLGIPENLSDGVEARIASPWKGICEIAKETKADLIVIGSHGYSGIERLLGTTAATVVNHAECSVLIVR